jgi:hypothetical protein
MKYNVLYKSNQDLKIDLGTTTFLIRSVHWLISNIVKMYEMLKTSNFL